MASSRWVWLAPGGCGKLQVSVASPRWVWLAPGGCGKPQVGVAVWTSPGVSHVRGVVDGGPTGVPSDTTAIHRNKLLLQVGQRRKRKVRGEEEGGRKWNLASLYAYIGEQLRATILWGLAR